MTCEQIKYHQQLQEVFDKTGTGTTETNSNKQGSNKGELQFSLKD